MLFRRRKAKETALAELVLPDGDYGVFTYQKNGQPGVLVVNGALRRIAGHSELPVRLGIRLEFPGSASPQGMPGNAEEETLAQLTRDLELLLSGPPRRGFLALHNTDGRVREWMSYVTDLQTARSIAENIRFRFRHYSVTHSAELDQLWEGYRRFSRR